MASKPRQVAVILDATSPYQQKMIRGVAAYARTAGNWLLYVERHGGGHFANGRGRRVPEDVAVVGVDNHELMCELTHPPLSSVEQGARELGYRAAELLDRMMAGKRPRQIANHVAPERVVVRRSTDALGIDDVDVASAVRFIRGHACEHIRVADVIDEVAVSRSTLEARFRSIMGKTIHDEIHETMLGRAQELIATGGLTLKQVAREAGFSHVQHMTNLFRRRLGRTPGEFQRLARLGGQ